MIPFWYSTAGAIHCNATVDGSTAKLAVNVGAAVGATELCRVIKIHCCFVCTCVHVCMYEYV